LTSVTRPFVPLCRNFYKDAPIEQTLEFNDQVFAEVTEFLEKQYPVDLPLNLHDEAHFPADRNSVIYRKVLAGLRLDRQFPA
jgi:vanillate O-demethylase monooxygenase subunit